MQVTTIWKTTRPRETSVTPRLVVPRPPSRSTALALARDDIQAGSRPDSTAAAIVAATVTASTMPSTSNVM